MKYDIAKNEDGPLRSTLRVEKTSSTEKPTVSVNQTVLESRLRDVQDHLAIRYGTLMGATFPDTWRSHKIPSSSATSKLDHRQVKVPGGSHYPA